MSSPTFTTLPREIRDLVYDFLWDFEQIITPTTSEYAVSRSLYLFDHSVPEITLALLRVNHQLLAEAAPTFYGKRTFRLMSHVLVPFLQGVSRHRHLIKDLQVLETTPLPSRAFDILPTLAGLRSFTIVLEGQRLREVLKYLLCTGMDQLADTIDVTVRHEREINQIWEDGVPTNSKEKVRFTDVWKRADSDNRGSKLGVHCWVRHCGTDQNSHPGQPCGHDHHRKGRQILVDADHIEIIGVALRKQHEHCLSL